MNKKNRKQKNCKKTFCWWNGSNNADDQASVLFGICDMTSVLLVNHSAHTAWQNLSSWQRKQWGCTHWRQPLPHTTKPMLVHYSQRWICTMSDPFLSWYKLEEQYIYSLLIIYWYFYGQHFKISVEYCPLIINKIIYICIKKQRWNTSGLWTNMQHCAYTHTHTYMLLQTNSDMACGQILTAWHTIPYTAVHFSCPHLYGSNQSALWEHVDNRSFLIPL